MTAIHLTTTTVRRVGPTTAAGAAYVAAWVVGLTAFGTGPAPDAAGTDVVRWYDGHRLGSGLQSVLVHGLAALALALVLRAARRQSLLPDGSWLAGRLAVATSLVQCVLGVVRSAATHGDATLTLVHAIDRIDGLKMAAFVVMIAAALRLHRRIGLGGRTLFVIGLVAAASLVVSAIGYGFAVASLELAAAPALLGLLAWVVGVAVGLDRRTADAAGIGR